MFKTYNKSIYEKCLGPFLTIFGDTKAITPIYFLTGFLTLYPSGEREHWGKTFCITIPNLRERFYWKTFLEIQEGSCPPPGPFRVSTAVCVKNVLCSKTHSGASKTADGQDGAFGSDFLIAFNNKLSRNNLGLYFSWFGGIRWLCVRASLFISVR